jgi:hypothetical protein
VPAAAVVAAAAAAAALAHGCRLCGTHSPSHRRAVVNLGCPVVAAVVAAAGANHAVTTAVISTRVMG